MTDHIHKVGKVFFHPAHNPPTTFIVCVEASAITYRHVVNPMPTQKTQLLHRMLSCGAIEDAL